MTAATQEPEVMDFDPADESLNLDEAAQFLFERGVFGRLGDARRYVASARGLWKHERQGTLADGTPVMVMND